MDENELGRATYRISQALSGQGKVSLKPVYLAYGLLFFIVVLLLIVALSPADATAALYTTCEAAPIWQG
jgi:hypothetical protein